jgi:hypothetical protein
MPQLKSDVAAGAAGAASEGAGGVQRQLEPPQPFVLNQEKVSGQDQ